MTGLGHPNRTIGNRKSRNWICEKKVPGTGSGMNFAIGTTRVYHHYAVDRALRAGKSSEQFAHFHLTACQEHKTILAHNFEFDALSFGEAR